MRWTSPEETQEAYRQGTLDRLEADSVHTMLDGYGYSYGRWKAAQAQAGKKKSRSGTAIPKAAKKKSVFIV